MFAYGGWQNANYVAEEIKDPKRILPICLLLGTAIVALVYITINVAYLKALGLGGLAATTTPASDSARLLFGAAGDRFVTAAIAISTFGFLNLCVLAPTRVYYAMAADGAFFPQVARLHPKYQTPSLAIVLQSTWAIALTLTGTYGQLLDYVVFADWIFFGLTVASVFVFRRTMPDAPRPFRTWGYPVTPALFVIAAIAIVFSVIRVSPVQSAIGAALMIAGVPAFYYLEDPAPGSRLPAPVMNLPAPYMRWAKTRPRVTYDLASSGLMPVTTRELLGDATAADAFEISGPTDEGFVPLREAIAARYGMTARARLDRRRRIGREFPGDAGVARARRRCADRDAGIRSVDRRGARRRRERRALRAQLVEGLRARSVRRPHGADAVDEADRDFERAQSERRDGQSRRARAGRRDGRGDRRAGAGRRGLRGSAIRRSAAAESRRRRLATCSCRPAA